MDVNKGRFTEIFPVVTTVYKSTSPIGFCGGSEERYCLSVRFIIGASPPLSVNLNISEILHISHFFADSGAYVL